VVFRHPRSGGGKNGRVSPPQDRGEPTAPKTGRFHRKRTLDLAASGFHVLSFAQFNRRSRTLREDYLEAALKETTNPNILINMVSRRVKQLKHSHRPLVESLEKLSPEDIALREIIEGKITYELAKEE